MTAAGSRQGTPSSAGLYPACPRQARQRSDCSGPLSALSFPGRSAQLCSLGLLTLYFALNWLQAESPVQGHAAVVSVGLFPALPSQHTDFLLSAEKNLPRLVPVP